MLVAVALNSDGSSNGIFVALATLPHEENRGDENSQENEFTIVAGLRISLVQSERRREALIAHVERVIEGVGLVSVLLPQVLVVLCHVDVLASVLDDSGRRVEAAQ